MWQWSVLVFPVLCPSSQCRVWCGVVVGSPHLNGLIRGLAALWARVCWMVPNQHLLLSCYHYSTRKILVENILLSLVVAQPVYLCRVALYHWITISVWDGIFAMQTKGIDSFQLIYSVWVWSMPSIGGQSILLSLLVCVPWLSSQWTCLMAMIHRDVPATFQSTGPFTPESGHVLTRSGSSIW